MYHGTGEIVQVVINMYCPRWRARRAASTGQLPIYPPGIPHGPIYDLDSPFG